MTDLPGRLRAAGAALLGLRGALVAGEPWPLSDNYGHEAESTWGPRELLAHVDEMLTYWVAELDRVRTGAPDAPVAFGRVATDTSRLERIDAARRQDVGRQLDDIRGGLDAALAFIARLTPADRARIGNHPTRGALPIDASIERFLVSHLEEHVAQLREILDRPTEPPAR